jgi:hypothetical protein
MATIGTGDALYRLVAVARAALFDQGELAQLTYSAFDGTVIALQSGKDEQLEVSFPIGYRPDRTSIQSTRKYGKEDLIRRYQLLAFQQLPINGLVQLVTIVEALLGDVVRTVVTRYPQKLGAKRTIALQFVLEAKTLEDVHLRATDTLLNDLAYKSPKEFAESVHELLSINFLQCPPFHKYMELKATRDIHIHNGGIANDTYVRKSGTHMRVKSGLSLPVDIQYFLESYEACLQLTEWLEEELHGRWQSHDLAQSSTPDGALTAQDEVVDVEPIQDLAAHLSSSATPADSSDGNS